MVVPLQQQWGCRVPLILGLQLWLPVQHLQQTRSSQHAAQGLSGRACQHKTQREQQQLQLWMRGTSRGTCCSLRALATPQWAALPQQQTQTL